MGSHNLAGATIALVFSSLAFLIGSYELFSSASVISHTVMAWIMASISLFAIFCSAYMYYSKHPFFPMMNIVCALVVGILAITTGVHYLLACMIITLIGCIIQLA